MVYLFSINDNIYYQGDYFYDCDTGDVYCHDMDMYKFEKSTSSLYVVKERSMCVPFISKIRYIDSDNLLNKIEASIMINILENLLL